MEIQHQISNGNETQECTYSNNLMTYPVKSYRLSLIDTQAQSDTSSSSSRFIVLTDAGCLLYLLKVDPLATRIYLEVLGDLLHSMMVWGGVGGPAGAL